MKADQTALMHKLIRVFSGHMYSEGYFFSFAAGLLNKQVVKPALRATCITTPVFQVP